MSIDWAATIAVNLCLMACLVVRPCRSCWPVWGYVISGTLADWFAMSQLHVHLRGDLYNVPWKLIDSTMAGFEVVTLIWIFLFFMNDLVDVAAFSMLVIHLAVLCCEKCIWVTTQGALLHADWLNQQGWMAFHVREWLKVPLGIALAAFILKERNPRKGAVHA